MSTNLDYITGIPTEIRQKIFLNLPPQDLFGLGKVCKQWNRELTDGLFQKKCYDFFQSLRLFPNFYDPILKTAKSPWKVICSSLTGKGDSYIFAVSERIARAVHAEFTSYLSQCSDFTQSELENHESEMRSICGDYYQDPNSKIDQAWKFSQKNWSAQEDEELTNLVELFSNDNLDPGLQYWIDIAEGMRNIPGITEPEILDTLKKRKADPKIIRFYELSIKRDETNDRFYQLEAEREELVVRIYQNKRMINDYSKIIQNPRISEEFSKQIIFHILFSVAFLKKWGDHLPMLTKIRSEINAIESILVPAGNQVQLVNPELVDRIKEKINSLPNACSTYIWGTLYDECAYGAQEWQWSENHFHEHLLELDRIIFDILNVRILSDCDLSCNFNYEDCNLNPCLNPTFLKKFSKAYLIN